MSEYSERFDQPEPVPQSERIETLRRAILLLLDNIDYEAGNCRVNEMIGAILPREILRKAKEAVK